MNMSYEGVPRSIKEIPEQFKTQEICKETVTQFSYALRYDPDHLKTQEMCNEVMRNHPSVFFLIPDRFKTQELSIKAFEVDPRQLNDIPDYLKTQKMCDKAVKDDPWLLMFVPDWFVTQEQIRVWYDGDNWYDDDEIIEWYEGHLKRKAQKASIKEGLMPITWHPDRVMDWCVPEDEKKEIKKLFLTI